MSKFNSKTSSVTTNYEDGKAYLMSEKQELYTRVLTSLVKEETFYESAHKRDNSLIQLVQSIGRKDPFFVACLAVYARKVFHLRSVSHLLICELAKVHNGDNYISRSIEKICERPDDMTEIMSLWLNYSKKLSMQIKKGLAYSFSNFDEYQLAKYNRDGKVKLKDVLFLTHPNTNNVERQSLWNKLANDQLETPYTWEVELSKGKDKKTTWEELIDSSKLGYMALLRNLRNIIQANVSKKHITKLISFLTDPNQVIKSKQLPFRFFSAYLEIQNEPSPYSSLILDCLETAIEISIDNLPRLEGTTLIASDVSGSMEDNISKNSKVQRIHIGLLLSAIANKMCDNAISGVFGTEWLIKNYSKKGGIINNALRYKEGEVGCSTNGYKVIQYLLDNKIKVDRLFFFTDCQLYDSNYNDNYINSLLIKYRKEVNPNTYCYFFDLAGYGTAQIPQGDNKSVTFSGWSERIFDFVTTFEKQETNIFKEIEKML